MSGGDVRKSLIHGNSSHMPVVARRQLFFTQINYNHACSGACVFQVIKSAFRNNIKARLIRTGENFTVVFQSYGEFVQKCFILFMIH
jgi:hypothetical protein